MRRTTVHWLMALLLVVSLLGAACQVEEGGEPDPADDGGEQAAGDEGEDEPIVVGVNIEQSGDASVQGEAYAQAVQLLAERVNDDGGVLGRPLELEIVDNRTDPTEAVTQTQQLVEQDVVAMVGPGTSPTTLAAMDVILESGIPTFSMGSADPISEPAEDRPNVFKVPQHQSIAADVIVEHMQGENIERVGVIAVNNPYGDSGLAAFEALADEGEIDLVGVERFESADTDMTGQLRSLVAADAEAIVTVAIPPGAPTVRRNAVEDLGLELPMYHDHGAGAELFIELAGESADGALIAHPRTLIWDQVEEDHPQHDALQQFGTAYTEAVGEVSGFGGYAWDALGLIIAGIEESGGTAPDDIIQGLYDLEEYPGVNGVFRITEDDHHGLDADSMEILTVVDGEWEVAE